MADPKFVRLQDTSSTNPLFNGEEIILHCDEVKISGENIISKKEKGFQRTHFIPDDNNKLENNYSRRKTEVSYKGFSNPQYTISGFMSTEKIGGDDTLTIDEVAYKKMTPTRLFRLILSAKRFYLKEANLIDVLSTLDADGYRLYGDNGAPVVVSDYEMEPILGESKGFNFSLTFTEDKE